MRLRAAVAAAVLLLVAAYAIAVRQRGLSLLSHREEPAFTVEYDDELLEVRDGGLLTLAGERKGVTVQLTVEPLELPEYEGELTGLLPLYAEEHVDVPEDARIVVDERARLGDEPGYEIAYETATQRRTFVFGDGVLLELTRVRPATRDRGGGRKVELAARDALRSLQLGLDRE